MVFPVRGRSGGGCLIIRVFLLNADSYSSVRSVPRASTLAVFRSFETHRDMALCAGCKSHPVAPDRLWLQVASVGKIAVMQG